MDRTDHYYRQKVTEAELDEDFDYVETAMHNLAVDIGLEGVVAGAVISENSPTGMSVLSSASCRAYDQAGQRIYYAPQQVVDCSQDYNGVSTTPGVGMYATLMITLAFDRLLDDLRTDGNGASVYYKRYESFEIKVTKGADSGSSPSTPPSAPSDELILCDIEIQDTTTSITNAMIDTSRRQNFNFTDAEHIDVTSSAWSNLDNTAANVQEALDSADDVLIDRDSSGYIDEDLEFNAAYKCGTTSQPSAESNSLKYVAQSSGVTDAFVLSAARTVTKRKISLCPAGIYSGGGWAYNPSQTIGSRAIGGSLRINTGGTDEVDIPLTDIPNGVSLQNMYITWYEDSTNQMDAQLYKKDYQGVESAVSNLKSKTTANAWDDDDNITFGSPETIDLDTYDYYLRVIAPTSANPSVVSSLSMTYTVIDVGDAAT